MRPFLILLLILSIVLLALFLWRGRQVTQELDDGEPFPIRRLLDIGDLPGDRLIGEIRFPGKCRSDLLDIYTDGIYHHIALDDPEPDISRLFAPDEVVLPAGEYSLVIDYPVAEPVELPLKPADPRGFTRAGIAREIAKAYRRLYEEEERTAEIKVTPSDERWPVLNRNRTDGAYGIWGHDLGDLALDSIRVIDRGGQRFLTLSVDS